MAVCKTGAEHIRSLQDGRKVFIDGQSVADVTTHPAFRNSVASAASLYDFQAAPEQIEFMTFAFDGSNRRANRGWQMPRNYAETVERRKALIAWAELSYGFMGRSPDHLASALVGQRMGLDVFVKYNPARAKAFADYFDFATRSDLFLTYVIINPQADRSKDWGEQEPDLVARVVDEDSGGITVRGAKMLGTSSIMANEVLVANLQPLKPGEEDLAFSCAVPMNIKGLRVLSRKSYENSAVSVYDNPVSSRFDENDAIIHFDDVKVPWDRVFVHRDVDMCRAQFHDTPGHIYQNYQSQIRLVVKLKFLVALARKLTEAIGTVNMPQVREQLGRLAANAGMVEFDDVWHRSRGLAAGRMVGAEQAPRLFSAGDHAGSLSEDYQHHPRACGRRLHHVAVVVPRLRKSRDRADHPQDAAFGGAGARGQGQVPEGGVGCGRLGIRFAPHAI